MLPSPAWQVGKAWPASGMSSVADKAQDLRSERRPGAGDGEVVSPLLGPCVSTRGPQPQTSSQGVRKCDRCHGNTSVYLVLLFSPPAPPSAFG